MLVINSMVAILSLINTFKLYGKGRGGRWMGSIDVRDYCGILIIVNK